MKALIPAAGRGTRLRPLTDETPKPLVNVQGKGLIEYIIEDLRDLGISEISVIKGYMGHKLERELNDREYLSFIQQEEQLGTAHAVGLSSFDRSFMVINGDIFVHRENLERIVRTFNRKRKPVIGSKRVENPEEFGVLDVQKERVEGITEKPDNPPTNIINTGIYIFTPEIYEYIERTEMSPRGEYEITDSIQTMMDDDKEFVHTNLPEYWIDVGRQEDLKAARDIQSQKEN